MNKETYQNLTKVKSFMDLCMHEHKITAMGFPTETGGFWSYWFIFSNKVSDKELQKYFLSIRVWANKAHGEMLDNHGIIRIYDKKLLVLS